MLRRFFAWNRSLARRIEPHLPQYGLHPIERFEQVVGERLQSLQSAEAVVDVGGGKHCPFAARPDNDGSRIFALDISYNELLANQGVDGKVVADAARSLPFADATIDLLVSRAVLEHLADVGTFIRESARVIRAGGYCIYVFPSRLAPFALINRAIPNALARRLIAFFHTGSDYFPQENCGFRAYYDRCTWSQIRGLLDQEGFDIEDAQFGYYQSYYFDFFLPAYLVSVLYEIIIRAVRARNLSPYILVVARRRSLSESDAKKAVVAPVTEGV